LISFHLLRFVFRFVDIAKFDLHPTYNNASHLRVTIISNDIHSKRCGAQLFEKKIDRKRVIDNFGFRLRFDVHKNVIIYLFVINVNTRTQQQYL